MECHYSLVQKQGIVDMLTLIIPAPTSDEPLSPADDFFCKRIISHSLWSLCTLWCELNISSFKNDRCSLYVICRFYSKKYPAVEIDSRVAKAIVFKTYSLSSSASDLTSRVPARPARPIFLTCFIAGLTIWASMLRRRLASGSSWGAWACSSSRSAFLVP